MKKLVTGALAALLSFAALAATTTPVQLISPAGSTAGQVIASTGPTTAPAWGGFAISGIAAIAANTVLANTTGSSASPTAFSMPSCNGSSNALQYASGTGFVCGSNYALLSSYAAPPAIGNTTPSTGKFTTLTTTAMSRVLATTSNALSVPNNTFTTITTWTPSLNQGANFVASTGVYTAPAAGLYDIRAGVRFSSLAVAANIQCLIAVFVNGTQSFQSGVTYQSNVATIMQTSGAWLVNLAANDVVTIRVFQNSTATGTLDGSAANFLNISQLP